MDIGSRIRRARKDAGLTQEQLARRADMSLKGMGDIERGGIPDPHYSSLSKIASALGISIAELVGEEEPAATPLAEVPEGELSEISLEEFSRLASDEASDEDLRELYRRLDSEYTHAELEYRAAPTDQAARSLFVRAMERRLITMMRLKLRDVPLTDPESPKDGWEQLAEKMLSG